MDIQLITDPSLPDRTFYVSDDLDDDLLASMKASDFDIVVEHTMDESRIRMSPVLCDQIMQWMTLQRVTRSHD